MYNWRVYQLPNALLVPSWEEYQIVRIEAEILGPGKGVLEFGSLGHRIVCIDCRFRRALIHCCQLDQTAQRNTDEQLLGYPFEHLLVAFWHSSILRGKLDFKPRLLECCIWDCGF